MLATCLALVRPVNMNDRDAEEWLRVAAKELIGLPLGLVDNACAVARRKCTHHGQIIPTIMAELEPELARQRSIDEAARAVEIIPRSRRLTAEQWIPTREELDAIKQQAAQNLAANR